MKKSDDLWETIIRKMNRRYQEVKLTDMKIDEVVEKDKHQNEFAQVEEEDCGGIGDS